MLGQDLYLLRTRIDFLTRKMVRLNLKKLLVSYLLFYIMSYFFYNILHILSFFYFYVFYIYNYRRDNHIFKL